jgi:acetylornithine deacetylase/succinyl-diaminopimelate desuccinylase-like protein
MRKLSVVLLLASAACGQTTIDWEKQKTEILAHFRDLVQINTAPPGNETKAVEYLKKVLEAEGIPIQTFAKNPDRANLVARIKGNGSKRPLLILAHTDVVGVQMEKWPLDPFAAIIKDGYIWGRGTRDDKPNLTANLEVMLLIKRSNLKLDRDVIFLAESAEEADTTGVGINFMVGAHLRDIEAEYAITEGGGGLAEGNRVSIVNIGTAEKVPARVRRVATGSSGHGSVPRLDNALIHLGAAVEKVGRWETPMRLNDTTRTYFEKLATISTPDKAKIYNALLSGGAASEAAQHDLAANDPRTYSMLRTSVVPTMLKAGVGPNVIPSEAEATLDIRALPDEDIQKFYAEMGRVIGDPEVKIVPLPATRPHSPASHLNTEMYKILEEVSHKLYAGSTVLPTMSTGASDMAQLRNKGIDSYGIGPITTSSETEYGAHSDVERILESSLYQFVEFTWNAVTAVAVHK